MFAADAIPLWPNHSGPQLMKDLKGGFVSRQAKLPLKLESGLPWCLGRHQIRRPKPRRKRRMAGLHDAASRQGSIGLAGSATQYDG